ncbi:dihydrolipoamide acetyltransferase family protein [Ligilactobacillus pobuzihii]|uniref:Dihydrolipoamide acetyltransferase component of pyruvate dehydrogenase complex n=1 Tax=Ligilactobacillus pobuzihii TaxID=449659 RepID=A0A0R2L9R4_9LACO|nr:dihydrolipoamide acetyltransferase family protein [Ligilactobacillus pobuzihii]KRK10343.1 branched-chain alpha-keto acid dehydrogenase subunit E2 [Ligilactobacillus pobuzihii E100301 = KCTC 13174]KRN98546.1 branched-chain alpha-keto acid dehydrogenase subunit E2 [Ligilactobacillus pobuzihii]GEN47657.1 dihydrolipoamide acetyltransferase component of pyruvate dehydrogenase complex [Ligilactobacillus pobuzihii]
MATAITMPKLGLTMTEGTVEEWTKNVGDKVEQGEVVARISSEKLTSDIEAPASGTLLKIMVQEGENLPIKQNMAYVGEEGEEIPEGAQPVTMPSAKAEPEEKVAAATTQGPPARKPGERIFVTPLARKVAQEKGVDYSLVTGTGGNGRITRRDVERYAANKPTEPAPSQTQTAAVPQWGAGLSGMRKAVATNMMQSVNTTAQVTLQRKVDLQALMEFRTDIKAKAGDLNDGQMSINTLITRAAILALQDTPQMNSNYADGKLTRVDSVNIGEAVGLAEGLIVPIVKNAQNMNLTVLGRELKHLADLAREGGLTPDQMTGGTFTVTNMGKEGIEYFTPIINPPEIGILGVGTMLKELTLNEDGQIGTKSTLPLSLTFDHQIIDGQQAAQFLGKIVENLQDPYKLIL